MIMRGEKQLTLFASRTEDGKVRDDIFVSITIHNVPASLVKEFCQKVVWPSYPGGISDAIPDMMKKALQEQK
jgi:hypothetical protein